MPMNSQLNTRMTLIQRAKAQSDEEAWHEFVAFYQGFIFKLLHSLSVPTCDQDDLAQKILVKLWQSLPNYEKQQAKFRSWLSTIIRHTAISYFREQRRFKEHLGQPTELSENLVLGNQSELDQMVEADWKKHLTQLAMKKIEKAYRGQALEVFKRTLDGQDAASISQQLQLTIDSVYTLRNRVKKSFVQELQRLMHELEF